MVRCSVLSCFSSLSDEFTRAVYVATGIKLTRHLVNTVFKIFDEDHDDKLSHKEFIGVMKDRLHRGGGVRQQRLFKCHPSLFYDTEGDRTDVPTRPTLLLPRQSGGAASHRVHKKGSGPEVLDSTAGLADVKDTSSVSLCQLLLI